MGVEGKAIDIEEVVNSVRPEVVNLDSVLALRHFVCGAGGSPETWFHHPVAVLGFQHVQSAPKQQSA